MGLSPDQPHSPPAVAFQLATLKGPRNTAMQLIRWGLAVGLQRKRLKGGCGGL